VRTYEVIFILDPGLADDAVEAAVTAAKAVLGKEGAEPEDVQKWGKKRLAYEIKKRREGHYIYFKVQAAPKAMAELSRHLRMADVVLKQLTVLVPPPSRRRGMKVKPLAAPVAEAGEAGEAGEAAEAAAQEA
jgi:small subunit ribosomal protein S6